MKIMKTESLLETYFLERNSSQNTQRIYKNVVKLFEEHTGKKLSEIITEAETEDTIKWQKSSLYYYLISFRKYLYEKFQPSTAQMYFTVIKTIIRHFDINILPLKPFSTKKYQRVELTPEDIITPEELRLCVEVKNPLVKATALTMAHMGFALIDLLNLTIRDYYDGTSKYHSQPSTVTDMIHELNIQLEGDMTVIPIFKNLTRQKTGTPYSAIGSPEMVAATNSYLLYREKKEKESIERYNKEHPDDQKIYPGLQLDDPLFRTNHGSLERMYREVNDAVKLGNAGNYVKFAPHMMRRFHATQLHEAGMSEYKINLLQGRKSHDVIHKSYLRVRLDALCDEYIQCLPFLLLDDSSKFKSELDLTKDKLNEANTENNHLKDELDKLNTRVANVEEIFKLREKLTDDEIFELFS